VPDSADGESNVPGSEASESLRIVGDDGTFDRFMAGFEVEPVD